MLLLLPNLGIGAGLQSDSDLWTWFLLPDEFRDGMEESRKIWSENQRYVYKVNTAYPFQTWGALVPLYHGGGQFDPQSGNQ